MLYHAVLQRLKLSLSIPFVQITILFTIPNTKMPVFKVELQCLQTLHNIIIYFRHDAYLAWKRIQLPPRSFVSLSMDNNTRFHFKQSCFHFTTALGKYCPPFQFLFNTNRANVSLLPSFHPWRSFLVENTSRFLKMIQWRWIHPGKVIFPL